MKRKDYEKPTMDVVKLQHQTHLLQASEKIQATRNSYGEAQEEDWN